MISLRNDILLCKVKVEFNFYLPKRTFGFIIFPYKSQVRYSRRFLRMNTPLVLFNKFRRRFYPEMNTGIALTTVFWGLYNVLILTELCGKATYI